MAHSKSQYLQGRYREQLLQVLQGMEGIHGSLAAAGAGVCTAQYEDRVLLLTSLVCSLWHLA